MSLLSILIELPLTWGRETLGLTSAGLETFIQKHWWASKQLKKKQEIKQKRHHSPEFGKQNDLYCLKTDQSWKTFCLLLTALSETRVVPTVPWWYWAVCIARSAFSALLCVSAVTRNKTNAEETNHTSTVGGICKKMFLKQRLTWLTKCLCFFSSFVRSCNLFPIFLNTYSLSLLCCPPPPMLLCI